MPIAKDIGRVKKIVRKTLSSQRRVKEMEFVQLQMSWRLNVIANLVIFIRFGSSKNVSFFIFERIVLVIGVSA